METIQDIGPPDHPKRHPTWPPNGQPPASRSSAPLSLETAVERGIAGGIAAGIGSVGEMLAKPADPAAPKPDNRPLIVALVFGIAVVGLWLWSGQQHTARMNRLEDRVDAIEGGMAEVRKQLTAIHEEQIRMSYASIAIAAKVGATIPTD